MQIVKWRGRWYKKTKKEIRSHPKLYILLTLVLLVALFVRVYRTEDLMGFYYDQGRDALVIWKLWHEGKPFLIGPVSGLAGIFLGPLYYYLIAPFYLIGGGDPRLPAIFLAFLTVAALPVLYVLGWEMHSRVTGFIALLIGSFSYYLVLSGRWLANPTPMFLTSMLLLFSLWKIVINKKVREWYWIWSSLLIGISLQFESASAVFYLPMILVFAVWQRKKLPNIKIILVMLSIFFITLLPQILFNFRHDNLIFNSFKRVLIAEKSFRNPISTENFVIKKDFLWNVFNSKIFPNNSKFSVLFYTAFIVGLVKMFIKKRKEILLLVIFLGVPALGYFFFQGNEGHIYDYYLTGYYLPLVLLFALGLGFLWSNIFGKAVVVVFIIVFLNTNTRLIKGYLTSPHGGPGGIALGTEMQAVDWVYGNSRILEKFNVDVYVPPVIPHSYDYLFLWRGTKFCGNSLCGLTFNESTPTLYTLFEDDPGHPEKLDAWLERQKGIGRVVEQIRFGGVTVQRRNRI